MPKTGYTKSVDTYHGNKITTCYYKFIDGKFVNRSTGNFVDVDDDFKEESWTMQENEHGSYVKVVKSFEKDEHGKLCQKRECWYHFKNNRLVCRINKSGCSEDGQWHPVYGDSRRDYCYRQEGDTLIEEVIISRFCAREGATPCWRYVGKIVTERSPRQIVESHYVVCVSKCMLRHRTVTTIFNNHYSVCKEYQNDAFTDTLRLVETVRTYTKTL